LSLTRERAIQVSFTSLIILGGREREKEREREREREKESEREIESAGFPQRLSGLLSRLSPYLSFL
jgi:hypothetical protein